jgi:hypothetical protein
LILIIIEPGEFISKFNSKLNKSHSGERINIDKVLKAFPKVIQKSYFLQVIDEEGEKSKFMQALHSFKKYHFDFDRSTSPRKLPY